jgi:peptidoglycan/xylan/chitin deacetylase (PgdA/CDA1 family)
MKKKLNTYGVMFHYFHDNKQFKKSQGSLSIKDLKKIIKKIGIRNIKNPADFIFNLKKKNRKKNICLTFDDSLKCQLKVALPLLEKLKIKAFFFVTTSIFTKTPNLLEIHRFFREKFFKNNEIFYEEFYKFLKKSTELNQFLKKKKFKIEKIQKMYPFYTFSDVQFRIVRDSYLSRRKYDSIMKSMFRKKKFNYKKKIKDLYFDKKDLIKIANKGHFIGLHSHTHPNTIANLNYKKQHKEFTLNKSIIEKITKKKVVSASFPRGDYNYNTLRIFKKINLSVAFKDNPMSKNIAKNFENFEISRKNHHQVFEGN